MDKPCRTGKVRCKASRRRRDRRQNGCKGRPLRRMLCKAKHKASLPRCRGSRWKDRPRRKGRRQARLPAKLVRSLRRGRARQTQQTQRTQRDRQTQTQRHFPMERMRRIQRTQQTRRTQRMTRLHRILRIPPKGTPHHRHNKQVRTSDVLIRSNRPHKPRAKARSRRCKILRRP